MSDEYGVETSEISETPEATPGPLESDSQPEPSGAVEHKARPEEQDEKPAPFHEHPRFKELIEQNREAKAGAERYQQELARLQQQLSFQEKSMESMKQQFAPKKEEPVDPFIQALEQINPEYAKSLRSLQTQAAKAEQLEKQWNQYQAQQFAEKAYNHFDNLLSSNKVNDTMDKELYKSAVEAEVYRREARGERLNLQDLDKIFNGFHQKYSKLQEERERSITSKYSSAKRSDVAPTPTTGGAATSPTMKKFSSIDSEDTIKWVAQELRRAKQQG